MRAAPADDRGPQREAEEREPRTGRYDRGDQLSAGIGSSATRETPVGYAEGGRGSSGSRSGRSASGGSSSSRSGASNASAGSRGSGERSGMVAPGGGNESSVHEGLTQRSGGSGTTRGTIRSDELSGADVSGGAEGFGDRAMGDAIDQFGGARGETTGLSGVGRTDTRQEEGPAPKQTRHRGTEGVDNPWLHTGGNLNPPPAPQEGEQEGGSTMRSRGPDSRGDIGNAGTGGNRNG